MASIGPLPTGAVPAWTVYLASDDADATADAVSAPGGPVLMGPGPGDVGPVGQMFVAADPAEAVFGVWQHGEHIGAGVVNEPGGLVWEDNAVPDPDAIRPFSAAVFGYRYDPAPGAGTDYTTFTGTEPYPLGGIGGVVPGSPPHWLAYLLCRGRHRCRGGGDRAGRRHDGTGGHRQPVRPVRGAGGCHPSRVCHHPDDRGRPAGPVRLTSAADVGGGGPAVDRAGPGSAGP